MGPLMSCIQIEEKQRDEAIKIMNIDGRKTKRWDY